MKTRLIVLKEEKMSYKYFFLLISVLAVTACNGKGSKDEGKTNVEKCVEGVNSYWDCIVSLGTIDMNDTSQKKQQCDNQFVQYAKEQALSGQKMNKVMTSVTEKIFSSFSTSAEGAGVSVEGDIPEDCKQKQNDNEKKKCILQNHFKEACQYAK